MPLKTALSLAASLRDALRREVDLTREDRQALRSLGASQLLEMAARRESFHAHAAALQRKLHDALAVAGAHHGLPQVNLSALESASPEDGAALSRVFAEIRALSAALRELDAVNQHLAGRALDCVRGYLSAVSPRPAAYDRRGGSPAHLPAATLSQRV